MAPLIHELKEMIIMPHDYGERIADLIARAAEVFADGGMVDTPFLIDNNVTNDECIDLLAGLAEACRQYVS